MFVYYSCSHNATTEPTSGRFPSKSVLHFYKVSLCEYCQRQSCEAFTMAYLSV